MEHLDRARAVALRREPLGLAEARDGLLDPGPGHGIGQYARAWAPHGDRVRPPPPGAALAGVAGFDALQRRHAIRRNFPVLGRARYLLESIGPELRQYIVARNDEERPFSRDQRRWVYASSKRELNTFGFGTDNEIETVDSLLVIKHSPFPVAAPAPGTPGAPPDYAVPAGKVLGAAHGRRTRSAPRRS